MTDPTPAVGGLSEAERSERDDLALVIGRANPRTNHVYDSLGNDACAAVADVVLASDWLAARTEAADREVARVTAAVEALAERWEWEADNQAQWRGRSYAERLRAALSSADTTALEGLLDRERAKAAGEALREAADRGRKFLGDTDGSICWDWLADRAVAVSPEGGDA